MKTLITGASIVNEGRIEKADVALSGQRIEHVKYGGRLPKEQFDHVIDAKWCLVMPGAIDEHVHFREPGLTAKADIESESMAAAAGGVTTYFDMPNTLPQTTTLQALDDKFLRAQDKSVVNYSFFFGVTNTNAHLLPSLEHYQVPGVKLFMGSSTGDMLVDKREALEAVFAGTRLPIMAHCEDTAIIERNKRRITALHGADPAVEYHTLIRSEEACVASSQQAVNMAMRYGARLHLAHLSTAAELQLVSPQKGITAEATVGHLLFSCDDYAQLGTRIKVNPAIKTAYDRDMLRQAVASGLISAIGTDHAPHLLADKQGGSVGAASGMPMVQFAVPAMLTMATQRVLEVQQVVELMCHAPARLFGVRERGFIRPGYKADLAIVRQTEPYIVTDSMVVSRCGWTPLHGTELCWKVMATLCNGRMVYNGSQITSANAAEAVEFHA